MARRRSKVAQLELGTRPANELGDQASLDDVLGPARVVGGCDAPSPAERRAASGRAGKRAGDALEAWTRAQLDAAVMAQIITWFAKVEAGARYRRERDARTGDWSQRLVWGARAAADFVAVRARDGVSIAIECKSVEGARLAREAIEPQQVHHLAQTHCAGGVALVVVEFRDEGQLTYGARQYCVPWDAMPWQRERSAWSVPEAPLARWKVRGAGEVFDRLRGR